MLHLIFKVLTRLVKSRRKSQCKLFKDNARDYQDKSIAAHKPKLHPIFLLKEKIIMFNKKSNSLKYMGILKNFKLQ